MCPEMPFPIGSNVASTVKITDSNGNDILVSSGNLKVAEQVLTNQSIMDIIANNTIVHVDAWITSDQTVLTVSSGKKMIIFNFGFYATGASGSNRGSFRTSGSAEDRSFIGYDPDGDGTKKHKNYPFFIFLDDSDTLEYGETGTVTINLNYSYVEFTP